MMLKVGILLGALPLAAVMLREPPAMPAATPVLAVTEEDRACQQHGSRLGHEVVRVPWTPIGVVADDVEVLFCVLRGDADAPLAFARNAERVRFALAARGDEPREGSFAFVVRTRSSRIELGPARVHVAPGRYSCRVEICQAFTEPGELVLDAAVRVGR